MTDLLSVGQRIESLLDAARASPDPRAAERSEELVRLVTELYGAGLERLVELVGEVAPDALVRFVSDELLAGLLVIHGLHPEGVIDRVERALESVRPLLAAHGGDVELVDVDLDASAVRLRLLGSCDGCPSSTSTLQHAVEEAILTAAPEIVIIDVEEPEDQPGPAGTSMPVALVPKPTYDSCPAEPALR